MHKRVICIIVAFSVLICMLSFRVGYITLSGDYIASSSYNSYKLTIDKKDYNLYYSNGDRINNNIYSYVAVIRPNEKCIGELSKVYSYTEVKEIVRALKQGYPVVRSISSDKKMSLKYIKIFRVASSELPSKQLLSDESGGVLHYTDKTVFEKNIYFNIDARGRFLSGDEGKIEDINYNSKKGVKLSLDGDVQKILETSLTNMNSGCALIMDVHTASIIAAVSKPDTTYTNKIFSQYTVGSVFKLIVAACAIENNIDPEYDCNAKIQVGDTIFSCQKYKKHSKQHIREALANSCNCYFVNLANQLGSKRLLDTAKKMGFNASTKLTDKWIIKNACLPTNEELKSKGELALFGFGQGKLTASPLQICNCLCTISNYGNLNTPRLLLSYVDDNGISTDIEYPTQKNVLKKQTTEKLIDYMRYVVTDGTAYYADSFAHKSAGKTATAQTGQYINGNELLNTWFAGIYPYDKPKYAIVIMTEQGTSGGEDCCPIFSTIVEKLELM